MKQINDTASRLNYLTEKVTEMREQINKAEKLKEQ